MIEKTMRQFLGENPDMKYLFFGGKGGVGKTVLAGAAVMNVDLVTKAADATLSSGGTVITSLQFPATAAAGTVRYVKIGPGMERLAYLGAVYGAVGANITSGNMNCWLGTAPPKHD